ncbi:MAG: hypothetical protein V7637_1586 [Mycobacteriales bacterium]|jgi:poly-gamma-glutamate synthesis protein (capsule biosynthesis protein)
MARYADDRRRAADVGAGASRSGPRRLLAPLITLLAVAVVVGGLVAAARTIQPAQRPSFADPTGPGAASPTQRAALPAPAGTPGRPARPTRFTIAFAGDVHFTGRTASLLANPVTAFGPISTTLARADLAMVNLETAITDRGTPEPKSFTFRAPASAFTALRAAGVDVATMANNHAADYGAVGVQDSLDAIASTRFPVVGFGATAVQAYAPWYGTVAGRLVAVIGASQIKDRTLSAWSATDTSPGIASAFSSRLVASVQAARKRAEVVVVYLHWGVEGNECPAAAQAQLAGVLSRAGADVVIGTHAHLLLGGGWLGSTYVGYGLGNFVWWRDNAFSNDTGVITLTLQGRRVVAAYLTPAHIDARGVPQPVTGGAAGQVRSTWDRVYGCSGLAQAPPA